MRGIRLLAAALVLAGAPAIAEARPRASGDSAVTVSQSGDSNTAVVRQFGQADTANLVQTSGANTACLVQVGDNLSFNLTQSGGETASLMQNRARTHAIPLRACLSMHGGRRPPAR
jgi:hypothetical protein